MAAENDSRAEEEALLARMRGPYLASVSGKAEELAALLCRCVSDMSALVDGAGEASIPLTGAENAAPAPSGETPLAQAVRIAHSMAGSGASYGLPGITTRARSIEHDLKPLLDGEGAETGLLLDRLAEALELRAAIRKTRDGEDVLSD